MKKVSLNLLKALHVKFFRKLYKQQQNFLEMFALQETQMSSQSNNWRMQRCDIFFWTQSWIKSVSNKCLEPIFQIIWMLFNLLQVNKALLYFKIALDTLTENRNMQKLVLRESTGSVGNIQNSNVQPELQPMGKFSLILALNIIMHLQRIHKTDLVLEINYCPNI